MDYFFRGGGCDDEDIESCQLTLPPLSDRLIDPDAPLNKIDKTEKRNLEL